MRTRTIVISASLLLMLGVALGAFGSHGLRAYVSPESLAVWHTAVLYQLVHGLGLLAVAALRPRLHAGLSSVAAALLLIGIVLFSGSLHALVLASTPIIGFITPIGGVCFLVGWMLLAWSAVRGNWESGAA